MHDLGLRRGECVELDLGDVELDDNPAVSAVGKGKTESERLTRASGPCAALRGSPRAAPRPVRCSSGLIPNLGPRSSD